MKRNETRLLVAVVILVSMAFTSCKQTATEETATNTEYYRQILFSETPYDVIQGTHPISAEEAKDINHYRFTYNEEGKLTTVDYMRGDVHLGYSSMGAATLEIEYMEGKEIHHYFDSEHQPQLSAGAFQSVYSLDEDGNRTGLKFYDKEGEPAENWNSIAYYTWSVLPDGMIRENRFNLNDEETVLNEFCPFYELRFSYDEKGYVTRMANYIADTLYDCTVENCGDVGVSYFAFEVNDHGDLEQFTVYNTVGQLSNLYWGWAKFRNKVDESGNVVERTYWDQDDEFLGGKTNPINQMVYDDHGSVIEMKVLDKDGQLINHPASGVAITKYTYDKEGHPVDTTRLNAAMEVL